jgi:hypothetical protein
MTSFNDRPIPAEQILQVVRSQAFERLTQSQAATTHLSLVPRIFPAGHRLSLVESAITVRSDSLLVFVDEMPGANFAHPCRYQFYSPVTGQLVQEESAQFPPSIAEPGLLVEDFHAPLRVKYSRPVVFSKAGWRPAPWPWLADDDNRFALLFTSQISYRRHVEDVEFAWRTLRHRFNFPADHIYVLCYNGSIGAVDASAAEMATWVGDGTPYEMSVHAAATKLNLQAALTAISNRMNGDSLLFVHTNNHGSPSGLCVDNSSVLAPSEWASMLAGMQPFGTLVVTMEQCFSGAFAQPTLDNSRAARTSFASAVPADKTSAGDAHFDPWARAWIESVNGATAYGAPLSSNPDTDHNYRVSVKEAFDYSVSNDPAPSDDPQYADSPAGCGHAIYLAKSPSLVDILRALNDLLIQIDRSAGPNPPDPGPDWADELLGIFERLDAVARRAGAHPSPMAKQTVHTAGNVEDATVLFPTAGAAHR